MTQIIFLKWLKSFDLLMAERKVLLILDNCGAHVPLDDIPARIQLRNTTVFYLPPNTTSKLQTCDAGIIRNLKAYYRRPFNRLLLQRVEDKLPDPEKIDILEAIRITVPAWKNEVKAETIANCFHHCQIRSTAPEDQQPVLAEEELLDQEVVAELESQSRRFRYANPMDVRNLLNYSEEDVVTYAPTLDEVIQDHLVPEPVEEQADDDESQEVAIVRYPRHRQ
ncbi:hypothetical protein PsorP6_001154 [Peronosclerospora sorghi]|uniref:Uncharacterized protein n=1 Tax=Peronosclerospora sorghi TaxID=230839 RepID=A0ACC0WVD3_9STRA|nr:hypothetical protein PsorP6_001154 [Peronosclerospora sorghi]